MSNTLTSENFDRIWLEPREGADPYIGRQWCQDNQWGDDGIEYARADIAALQSAAETHTPPSPPPHLMETFTELLTAAEKVLEGLHARIDAADKHTVPVFYGIVDLSDAIHTARAALAATTEGSDNG